MQRLVSPQNTPPNQSFYHTLPLSTERLDIVPFSVALEPSQARFYLAYYQTFNLDIAPFPLGVCSILKSMIMSHILQPLAFWQEIPLASLPISLHTLADIRTLRFRFRHTVTSQRPFVFWGSVQGGFTFCFFSLFLLVSLCMRRTRHSLLLFATRT